MKKILSIVMIVAMLATSILIPVSAEAIDVESVTDWNEFFKSLKESDFTLDEELDGDGTEESPYLIASASDLIYVAAATNNYSDGKDRQGPANTAYYKLTADIDLAGVSWYGIGSPWGNKFSGTFDGNGHVIYNLTLASNQAVNGLFRTTAAGAEIKNVGIASGASTVAIEANNDANVYIGNFIGEATGSVTIENCFNAASLTVEANNGKNHQFGGFIGRATDAVTFTNSFNAGALTVTSNVGPCVAGLVGYSENSVTTMTNCFNTGAITVTVAGTSHIGGLAGRANSGLNATNCWNTGDVTVHMDAKQNVGVGGIIGNNYTATTFDSCQSVCNISVDFAKDWDGIGVLIGKLNNGGSVKNSSAGGTVTVTKTEGSPEYTGLFVGYPAGNPTFENCTCSVTGTKNKEEIADSYLLGDGGATSSAGITKVNSIQITAASMFADKYAQNGVVGTTNANSVRFVTELVFNSVAFQECGYKVAITYGEATKEVTLKGNVVYSSLKAAGETVTPKNGQSFIAYGISDIPADADVTFKVTPYVVTLDGDYIYGTQTTVEMTDGEVPNA